MRMEMRCLAFWTFDKTMGGDGGTLLLSIHNPRTSLDP